MYKCILIIIYIFNFSAFGQSINKIGELRYLNAKIIKVDTVLESFCGQKVEASCITLLATNKMQLTCNFGEPQKDIWKNVENKIYLYYAKDKTGLIHKSLINEINEYVINAEVYEKKHSKHVDFTDLNLIKSFIIDGKNTIPYTSSETYNVGDYRVFYLNKQVYKIVNLIPFTAGILTSFQDNIFFTKNGQKLAYSKGKYIRDTNIAKQIIAKEKIK